MTRRKIKPQSGHPVESDGDENNLSTFAAEHRPLIITGGIVFIVLVAMVVGLQLQLNSQRQALIQLSQVLKELQMQQASFSTQEALTTLSSQFKWLTQQQKAAQVQLIALAKQVKNPQDTANIALKAELNYLLNTANYRLSLMQDPVGAIALLKAAETLSQPMSGLEEWRTKLIAKVAQLEAVKLPNVKILSEQLAVHIHQVNSYPLLQGRQQTFTPVPETATPSTQGWQNLPQIVWQEMKQLVVIRYNDTAESTFLTQAQQDFVKQTLQLKLEAAKTALLQKNDQSFQTTLNFCLDWLDRYYDKNSSVVQKLQTNLKGMQIVVLNLEFPELEKVLIR